METTITIDFWGNIGRMEKKMETTIQGSGFRGYWENGK